MSAPSFTVPKGWTKGDDVEMGARGGLYVIQRPFTPFTGTTTINDVGILYYDNQLDALRFLSWWFARG